MLLRFLCVRLFRSFVFFFFNDTATTEIYTLSLHDALPISGRRRAPMPPRVARPRRRDAARHARDRKSTRLNSSHLVISYAVFCLKKKKNTQTGPCLSLRSLRVHAQISHQHTFSLP